MANENNMRDLGNADKWTSDSMESRLVSNALKQGYKFHEVSRDKKGKDIIYECQQAKLRYHVTESEYA